MEDSCLYAWHNTLLSLPLLSTVQIIIIYQSSVVDRQSPSSSITNIVIIIMINDQQIFIISHGETISRSC
jgi:hypothetical protein